ncbi:AbgT family transporter [Thermanaerovibrio acidaminovorans]|uniref:AbgT family transporter n=1 Tax=Thermanaerovibrio acidaminovorans TaxID=81462 RepID=UPI00248FEBD6|nr:AbgT family transporter [Thermanaerovibrio acidaminovorans]
MSSTKRDIEEGKVGALGRFIRAIEVIGNKLPHPFWLFVILSLLVIAISSMLSSAGTSVTYMAASSKAGEAPVEVTVAAKNLLSYPEMRSLLSDFVSTYVSFAPLGLILVMMLGIGLVEQTGFISALMRKTILDAPPYMVTAVLAMVGINANLASDAGIIFTPAIGGAVFKALGRNPAIGIIAGFAAASGGFTANFFIAGTDALLAGITESAAKGVGISAPTHPLINWYFLILATINITLVTTLITEKFIAPLLGDGGTYRDSSALDEHGLTDSERRGLRWALWAAVAFSAILLALTVPEGAFFRAEDGSLLPKSPLLSSVVPILFFLFFAVGVAYGIGSGTIKSASEVPKLMQNGLQGSLSFLVIALPAAIFIKLFNSSNMTTILAVKGAEVLRALNLGGIPLLLIFILLSATVNLFMISGSAKWLILAPIFVPMFSMVGFSPALTQLAYRIGDSSTNIISPLSYYIPVVIGLLEQYRRQGDSQVGIGTVLSLELPYALAYLVCFSIQLAVWYVLNLPLGPGVGMFM